MLINGILTLRDCMEKDEQLEPWDWDFDKEGLFIPYQEKPKLPKNCIDLALKKICGKDWDKPIKIGKNGFGKK